MTNICLAPLVSTTHFLTEWRHPSQYDEQKNPQPPLKGTKVKIMRGDLASAGDKKSHQRSTQVLLPPLHSRNDSGLEVDFWWLSSAYVKSRLHDSVESRTVRPGGRATKR